MSAAMMELLLPHHRTLHFKPKLPRNTRRVARPYFANTGGKLCPILCTVYTNMETSMNDTNTVGTFCYVPEGAGTAMAGRLSLIWPSRLTLPAIYH